MFSILCVIMNAFSLHTADTDPDIFLLFLNRGQIDKSYKVVFFSGALQSSTALTVVVNIFFICTKPYSGRDVQYGKSRRILQKTFIQTK